jgi:hypothetical protein
VVVGTVEQLPTKTAARKAAAIILTVPNGSANTRS